MQQSLPRLANPFRTRLRCDANRANAPQPRAKASWENKKGSVWSRREPIDCHSRRPDRVWHLEKTKPERCAAKDRQDTEPSQGRTYSCMPEVASACCQANTTIRTVPARNVFCLAKSAEYALHDRVQMNAIDESLPFRTWTQSAGEEIANGISHGIGLIGAIIGTPILLLAAFHHGDVPFLIG